jgi:hypothetical protein
LNQYARSARTVFETFFMPAHHGLWFDNDQSLSPVAPKSRKQDPEETIPVAKSGSYGRPFHSGQLLAEGKVL